MRPVWGCLTLLIAASLASPAAAQDAPKLAGSEVKPPKRTKFVQPEYPPEARSLGTRGIVILDIVIDVEGRVASVEVVRSVPPFDEAAVAAVRQWEYEVTRVDGRPVPVRLSVPITFALKLPDLEREQGAPTLRQGSVPRPPESAGPGEASAAVSAARSPDTSSPSPEPDVEAEAAGQAPEEEIIASPMPRTPSNAPPAQVGLSSVKGVSLGLGVPDLVGGRRPVVPPLARMAAVSGGVEVCFSVDAAGQTRIKSVEGPELLKTAAEQTVASWSFRRLSAHRLFLVAVFAYLDDEASAAVALQEQP